MLGLLTRRCVSGLRFGTRSLNTEVKSRIEEMIGRSSVVVFMKGVPAEPRCGFSNGVVQILRMHGVQFEGINVLEDEDIRQGIKEFSEWPTIPQIYFDKEFVGGCDVLLEMHQSGDILEELKKIGITSALDDPPK
ncbi:Glutaredoxin [Caligus rogercresseyi]|uniref:Glutaredoxin-related protein 5, mitochondrial n=1 Tax=Caligus rogercresseyi TaxID=217165 RepID=A0A7T8KBQ2_CALRO|nr:Glutaredoxin [Caligus rogercresseyi]|eukprot:TRINITY_DN2139_c0_g1_i1.p1 TRINITY_DN2139_c0_g1~~TRINITY_DN2139_c0_g1_i1.p1  ORF type:complete len:135 (-),score=52.91 TRINITY_DN2139_c0_g1_i1:361-765(-)